MRPRAKTIVWVPTKSAAQHLGVCVKTLNRRRRKGILPDGSWRMWNPRSICYSTGWLEKETGRPVALPSAQEELVTKKSSSGRAATARSREALFKELAQKRGEKAQVYWLSAKQAAGLGASSMYSFAKRRRTGQIPAWAFVTKNSRVVRYHAAYLAHSGLEQVYCVCSGITDALKTNDIEEFVDGSAALYRLASELRSNDDVEAADRAIRFLQILDRDAKLPNQAEGGGEEGKDGRIAQ